MRKLTHLILCVCLSVVYLQAGESQDSARLLQVLHKIDSSIGNEMELCYSAEMQFKSFGEDSFEIRNIAIRYKVNDNNPLYGYDMEFTEKMRSGKLFTIMILDSMYYSISEASRVIYAKPLPPFIEMGGYLETLNHYFIFKTYLYPFLHSSIQNLEIIDSIGEYILTCRTSDISTRKIYISKINYLPIKYISTMYSVELGTEQIQIVNFSYDINYKKLPSEAFSLSYYYNLDYNYKISRNSWSETAPFISTFPKEKLYILLSYPFISPDGDTIILDDVNNDYILLDFWYSSCLPCLKAMPKLSDLAMKYQHTSLSVYGVNCIDYSIRESLTRKLSDKQMSLPVLYGRKELLKELEINSFPSYYVIKKNGDIESISGGIDAVIEFINKLGIDE